MHHRHFKFDGTKHAEKKLPPKKEYFDITTQVILCGELTNDIVRALNQDNMNRALYKRHHVFSFRYGCSGSLEIGGDISIDADMHLQADHKKFNEPNHHYLFTKNPHDNVQVNNSVSMIDRSIITGYLLDDQEDLINYRPKILESKHPILLVISGNSGEECDQLLAEWEKKLNGHEVKCIAVCTNANESVQSSFQNLTMMYKAKPDKVAEVILKEFEEKTKKLKAEHAAQVTRIKEAAKLEVFEQMQEDLRKEADQHLSKSVFSK